MIVGIDTHKHTHTAALLEKASGELARHTFENGPEGFARLHGWLAQRGGGVAVIGIENPAGYGRPLVAALLADGHEVLTSPRGAPIVTVISSARARAMRARVGCGGRPGGAQRPLEGRGPRVPRGPAARGPRFAAISPDRR